MVCFCGQLVDGGLPLMMRLHNLLGRGKYIIMMVKNCTARVNVSEPMPGIYNS